MAIVNSDECSPCSPKYVSFTERITFSERTATNIQDGVLNVSLSANAQEVTNVPLSVNVPETSLLTAMTAEVDEEVTSNRCSSEASADDAPLTMYAAYPAVEMDEWMQVGSAEKRLDAAQIILFGEAKHTER